MGVAIIYDAVLQDLFIYSFSYIIGIFNDCIYHYQKDLSKVSQNVKKKLLQLGKRKLLRLKYYLDPSTVI